MLSATFTIDRTISVPPGSIVRTGYVPIEKIRLSSYENLSLPDIKEKYEIFKQNAPNQIFPCPIGNWEQVNFVIVDGRHAFVALMILGMSHILVAWIDSVN